MEAWTYQKGEAPISILHSPKLTGRPSQSPIRRHRERLLFLIICKGDTRVHKVPKSLFPYHELEG